MQKNLTALVGWHAWHASPLGLSFCQKTRESALTVIRAIFANLGRGPDSIDTTWIYSSPLYCCGTAVTSVAAFSRGNPNSRCVAIHISCERKVMMLRLLTPFRLPPLPLHILHDECTVRCGTSYVSMSSKLLPALFLSFTTGQDMVQKLLVSTVCTRPNACKTI